MLSPSAAPEPPTARADRFVPGLSHATGAQAPKLPAAPGHVLRTHGGVRRRRKARPAAKTPQSGDFQENGTDFSREDSI